MSTPRYSTLPLDQLLIQWERGDLTADQMVGYMLQHIILLEQRIRQLEHPPTPGQARPAAGPARKTR